MTGVEKRKTAWVGGRNGDFLFSRRAAPQVSSELKSLTAVFGMGTGVPSSLLSPVHLCIQAVRFDRAYPTTPAKPCQAFFTGDSIEWRERILRCAQNPLSPFDYIRLLYASSICAICTNNTR